MRHTAAAYLYILNIYVSLNKNGVSKNEWSHQLFDLETHFLNPDVRVHIFQFSEMPHIFREVVNKI